MPTIVLHIYDAGLYADFGINIYYLGAAIYGWMMWKYGSFVKRKLHLRIKEGQQELPITRMPIKYYLPLGIVFAVTFVGIAWILIRFTNRRWLPTDNRYLFRSQHTVRHRNRRKCR